MTVNVATIGIVGAGVMGRSIGLCAVQSGIDVRLCDAQADVAEAAVDWIAGQAPADAPRPQRVAGLPDLGGCEVAIEAVVENRAVKRRVLSALSVSATDALIATNTSSLSISELAGHLVRAERFCGLHFCHPVSQCPLVEIVPGPLTGTSTLDRAEALVRQLGLQPLRTRDVPGFAVNRLLFPYLEAAVALVRGGVEWQRIEQVAVEFGMRLGPLAQMDEIGIDVILRAAAAFHRGNPVVPPQSDLLLAMFQAGRLGRKSGRGFYDHSHDDSRRLDPAAMDLSAEQRTTPISCADEELRLRLFVPLLAAACELLQSGVVARTTDVQAALVGGLGCCGQAADLTGWVRHVTPDVLRQWMERLGLMVPDRAVWERLQAE